MQERKPKVSVIVVNFNGKPYLETCLRSVINQNYSDFEVILVDNDSNDGSVEYVRQNFPDMCVVANEKNLGYSAGINKGIERAKGEYFAPLNVDTEVERSWLASMVQFMEANPDVGAVTPKSLLYRNRDKVGVMGLKVHITGLGFVIGYSKEDSKLPKEPFQVAAVSGSSFLIRRDIVEQMGGLNEDNFMYYDDVDLSWMVNLMGYRIYCVPDSVIYHEYELGVSAQKLFLLEYGRWSSLICYLKVPTFIVLLPFLVLTETLMMGFCLIRGTGYIRAKMRAGVAVLRSVGKLMRRRRQVQRLRRVSDFSIVRRRELNYDWGQARLIMK